MLNIKHFLERERCVRGYHIIGNESLKHLKVFGSNVWWVLELVLQGHVTARGSFSFWIPR